MATYTPNLKLLKYEADDIPNLLDEYNQSMDLIDTGVHNASNAASVATEAASQATQKAQEAEAAANALTSRVAQAESSATAANAAASSAQQAATAAQSTAQSAQSAANGAVSTASKSLETAQSLATNKLVLCVGDSYATAQSDPSYQWPNALETLLQPDGYKIYNAAVSGTGWQTGPTNFAQQIQNYSGDEPGIILIAGGRNDIMNESQATSAVNAVKTACAKYPRARVIAVPYLYDAGVMHAADRAECAQVTRQCRACGFEVLTFAYLWLKGIPSALQSDGIHPNSTGAKIIAGYMAAGIRGAYAPRAEFAAVTANGVEASFVLSGGSVSVKLNGTANGNAAWVLPAWAYPDSTVSTIGYVNSGETFKIFMIDQGDTGIHVYSPPGSLGGCGMCASWPA